MTMNAHHVYLLAPSASLDDVRRFYGEALALTEVAKPDSLSHVPVLWFSAGAIVFHIGFPAEGSVGDGHTALTTANSDVARARFIRMGYAVDDNVIPMGYPRFYVRDPWGNQFEILSPSPID